MSIMDRRRWLVSAGGAALLAACKNIVHKQTDTGANGASGSSGPTGASGVSGSMVATTQGLCSSADWPCLLDKFDEGVNKQIQIIGINNLNNLKAADVHPYVEAAYKPRFDFVSDANNQHPPIIDWGLLGLHAERLGEICVAVFYWEKKDSKRFFLKPDPNRPFGQPHFDLARDMLGYWLNPHVTDRGPHFKDETPQQAPSIAGHEGDTACPLCP
jgi:hypothetical protein